MANVLFVDNFDSFTYNLVNEFESLGHHVTVVRNSIDINTLVERATQNDLLVISPGPGNPQQAGNGLALLDKVVGRLPVLGICLGHQMLVEFFGGKIQKAPVPVHGKASAISHQQQACFKGMSNPLPVGRYHSLAAYDIPDNFTVIAECEGIVMSVFDSSHALLGHQFHPESILTTQGSKLIEQSIHCLLESSHLLESSSLKSQ